MGTTITVTTDLTYNSLMNKTKSDLAHLVLMLADMVEDYRNAASSTPDQDANSTEKLRTRSEGEQVNEPGESDYYIILRCHECRWWIRSRYEYYPGKCTRYSIFTDGGDVCKMLHAKE